MKNLYTLIALTAIAILGVSCNDEWKDEQYAHYIGFRSPLNDQGVCEVYVPYSRTDADGNYTLGGEGCSNYELPVIVSGSLTNEQDIDVHVAFDPDTLEILNEARFQQRYDYWYADMSNPGNGDTYVTIPETMHINAGENVGLLDINFDFRGIDMSQKWVLPLQVVDDPSYGYQSHPRKNYAKAILRIYPFNDYSGVYSGVSLQTYVKDDEGNGAIVKNEVTGYVVDENTIFFYAGNNDETRTDRELYKIKAEFSGGTNGIVTLSCDNPEVNFISNKEASYRIMEEMDATQPFLMRRYVIINNIDYYYDDYTRAEGIRMTYHTTGSLTLQRTINTQIPDEDQAIEW